MADEGRAFDVVVIGGGITGAAAVRDLALRGIRAALYEKGDFSSGTTSKTSRLIHGGLRYLEGFHVGLVAESLRERDWLAARLPHLLRPVPILIPVYRGDRRGMATVGIGMRLYDLLARRKATPRYGTVPAAEAARRVRGLRAEGLAGGAVFYDYQILVPERLVVENLLSAAVPGKGRPAAVVRNHAAVEEIAFSAPAAAPGEAEFRLRVRDARTGASEAVLARAVINATGPWADRTRRLAGLEGDILYPTKGAHVVLPGVTSHALFVASAADDRMFYILPFDGRLLVGTTDTAYSDDPDGACAAPEDVAYLLSGARRVLPGSPLFREAPLYTYAGVRPLLKGKGPTESHLPRKHGVFREGPGGRFVTVAGGKLTTFRQMAADAVDAACDALGRTGTCVSADEPLPGEIGGGDEGTEAFVRELAETRRVPDALCRHLVSLYGRRAGRVLDIAGERPEFSRSLSSASPDIAAQAVLAAREEWAAFPEDAVLRRMHLGITAERGASALPAVARLLAAQSPSG